MQEERGREGEREREIEIEREKEREREYTCWTAHMAACRSGCLPAAGRPPSEFGVCGLGFRV